MQSILNFFITLHLPNEAITLLLSMLPVSEVRGALPIAMTLFKMSWIKAYLLSVLGNISIILPFIWFLEKFSHYLMRFKVFKRFFDWWFAKAKKNEALIQKYEVLGLGIFVAIPLPMTGAWTGCVIAYLFGLKKWQSFLSIAAGVVVAGVIVLAITLGGMAVI